MTERKVNIDTDVPSAELLKDSEDGFSNETENRIYEITEQVELKQTAENA